MTQSFFDYLMLRLEKTNVCTIDHIRYEKKYFLDSDGDEYFRIYSIHPGRMTRMVYSSLCHRVYVHNDYIE